MMESHRSREQLIISDNALLDGKQNVIATVSKSLEQDRILSYVNLFAAAPGLLDFLETKTSSVIEAIRSQPPTQPSMIELNTFQHRLPFWLDSALQAIALAYGEESSIRRQDLGLSPSISDDHALEDNESETVVRISPHLDKTISDEYLHLFLAAPAMLRIAEEMARNGMAAIEGEYEAGTRFDPEGADSSRFIVPEQLRFICDLVARAKGAIPITAKTKRR
jgi:hypothetical protein